MVSLQQRRQAKLYVAPPPDLLERVQEVVRLVAEQAKVIADQTRMLAAQEVRIAALEARPSEDEDGQPRSRGNWLRMKAAAGETGYSESGLRRLCRLGRCAADYSGPHLLVNVDSVPRRSVKVSKVQS
jgi:hypothetical protein